MNVYPVAQDVFRDVVSYSFSAVMIGMVVATVFLFLERSRVNAKARLTITVAGLITLAASMSYAAMNYQYSSGFFTSKLVEFRYADWTITTPLLLLKLVTMAGWRKVGKGTIAALLFLDIFMIGTGYVGEQQINHLAVAAGMTASTAAGAADGVVWTMFFVSCIAWLALAGILLTKVKAAGADLEPEEKSALNLLAAVPAGAVGRLPAGLRLPRDAGRGRLLDGFDAVHVQHQRLPSQGRLRLHQLGRDPGHCRPQGQRLRLPGQLQRPHG